MESELEVERGSNGSGAFRPERPHAFAQAHTLPPGIVEVRWVELLLEAALEPGLFIIEHRKPGSIPVLALHDHMLAKPTFEGEAEADRRTLCRLVQVVALAYATPVLQLVKNVAAEQVNCLVCMSIELA